MSLGTERGTYLTVDELREIEALIQALTKVGQDSLCYVSVGNVPLSDSNGEPLGVIGYGSDGFVYYPAGVSE